MRVKSSLFKRSVSPRTVWLIVAAIVACILLGFAADAIIKAVERTDYKTSYPDSVERYAAAYNLPEHLLYAVIKAGSDFDVGAETASDTSGMTYVGLTQISDKTFRYLSNSVLFEYLDDGMIYDPDTNIRYGSCCIARFYEKYGNTYAALAAYRIGEETVDAWIAASGNGTFDSLSDIPDRAVRRYVSRVIKARDKYDRLYGEPLPEIRTESAPAE